MRTRRGLAAISVGLVLLAACGTSGGEQPAASPSPSTHRCEGPAEQALARLNGTVVGRIGPDGATIAGKVWLEPVIEDTPVYGDTGKVDALLAVPQPLVELIACRGSRHR